MKILIAVYSDVPFWNLPASHVERLGRAFPGVEFVHAPDAVAAVRLIPGAEGAYAYQIHRLSLPRHRTCTACGPTASGTALARQWGIEWRCVQDG